MGFNMKPQIVQHFFTFICLITVKEMDAEVDDDIKDKEGNDYSLHEMTHQNKEDMLRHFFSMTIDQLKKKRNRDKTARDHLSTWLKKVEDSHDKNDIKLNYAIKNANIKLMSMKNMVKTLHQVIHFKKKNTNPTRTEIERKIEEMSNDPTMSRLYFW